MEYTGSRRVGLAYLALRFVSDPDNPIELGTYHFYVCPVCGEEAVYLEKSGVLRRIDIGDSRHSVNYDITARYYEKEPSTPASDPTSQSDDLSLRQSEESVSRPLTCEDNSEQIKAEPDTAIINQANGVEQSIRRPGITLSESRIAFYLLVSAAAGYILLRTLSSDEIMVALGTLNIAIIGAWIWAWLSKIRMLIQSFKNSQQTELARKLPGELGNA
jgi:hypothetical protein